MEAATAHAQTNGCHASNARRASELDDCADPRIHVNAHPHYKNTNAELMRRHIGACRAFAVCAGQVGAAVEAHGVDELAGDATGLYVGRGAEDVIALAFADLKSGHEHASAAGAQNARAECKRVVRTERRITRPERGAARLVVRVRIRAGAVALWDVSTEKLMHVEGADALKKL